MMKNAWWKRAVYLTNYIRKELKIQINKRKIQYREDREFSLFQTMCPITGQDDGNEQKIAVFS